MEIHTSANGAKWLIFEEYKIVDYKKQKCKRFDVSTKKFPGIPSDLVVNGKVSQEYYGACLMEMVVRLPPNRLAKFLDYQCKQFQHPEQWLNNLDMLAQANKHTDLMRKYYEAFNLITALVSKKLALLSGQRDMRKGKVVYEPPVSYEHDPRFKIEKIKEELEEINSIEERKYFLLRRIIDYGQLVDSSKDALLVMAINKELNFMVEHKDLIEKMMAEEIKRDGKKPKITKRIVWKEHPKLLASLFKQIAMLKNKEGQPIFNAGSLCLAQLICFCFCDENGESFSVNSMKTYIDSKHLDLKGKGWKIEITFFDDEDENVSNK